MARRGFTNADLTDANLWDANLRGADLTNADLANAHLWDANLRGSNLTRARFAVHATWTNAYYYTDNEPSWHPDMDQAWRDSVDIVAISPGDWNRDGVFDAADYTVWRDGDSPDSTTAGYALWVANFGQLAATGSEDTAAVPEPGTLLLALAAAPLRVRHG